jgi:L-ascorbate metabolism protein UlaG (beta-lactamase superfamily)
MELTWYGTATLKVSSQETSVVLDPFKRRNPDLPMLKMDQLSDVEAILVTHGHFDHIADVPVFSRGLDIPVFCPETVGETLSGKLNLSLDRIREFEVGETFELGDLSLKTYRGEHVTFDFPLIAKTLAQIFSPGEIISSVKNLADILQDHWRMPVGECVNWSISTSELTLLHTGSLGFDDDESYPDEVDILSLAYQGNSKIDELAFQITRQFQPQSVLLHHFDDAFPPITREISIDPFRRQIEEKLVDIDVIKPRFSTPIRFGG